MSTDEVCEFFSQVGISEIATMVVKGKGIQHGYR
jgi:hypothetical protein